MVLIVFRIYMLKIRLQRKGRSHDPIYEMVVAESKNRRDGRFVESLGHYNPQPKGAEKLFVINLERVQYWLSQGAQPTDTAASLIRQHSKTVAA
jgi:small subunit ribosomal protein S16